MMLSCPQDVPAEAKIAAPPPVRTHLHSTVTKAGADGAQLFLRRPDDLRQGITIGLTVTLPGIGTHNVRAVVTDVSERIVNVAWVEPDQTLLTSLAEYLLLGDLSMTPARLRAGGLPVHAVVRVLSYGYAGEEDLPEIRDLRLRAHQHEGRLAGLTAADFVSPFDTHARHIVCRRGNRIVGYVRVIFVDGDPVRSQYVSWGGHRVPSRLWRERFVEAGAGAVDPEFQRAGLLLPLMRDAVVVAAESGVRHVLGACEDDLVPIYRDQGFTVLETRQVEPRPGWAFRSHLICLDLDALAAGQLQGRHVSVMADAARSGRRQPACLTA